MIFLVGQVAQLQVYTAGFQAGNSSKAIAKVDVGSHKTGGLVFGAVAELPGNAGLLGHRTQTGMPGEAEVSRLTDILELAVNSATKKALVRRAL